MPRKPKLIQSQTPGTHLNPDYTGTTPTGPLPVSRGSVRSVHWSQLNPAWLVQECLNRGITHLPGRVRNLTRTTDDRWVVVCYLGHPSTVPSRDSEDWEVFYVSDAEVEAGVMAKEAA